MALDWMSNNYNEIVNALGDSGSNAGGGEGFARFASTLIDGYATTSNSRNDINKINQFVSQHQSDLQGSMSSIQDSLKKAELNVAWNEQNGFKVFTWLVENYPEDQEDPDNGSEMTKISISLLILSSILLQYFWIQFL